MTRGESLFDRVVAFENLHRSAYAVLRGKRGRESAGDLFFDLEGALVDLERELREGTYRPGPYHTFWIRDPKRRLISAAPLRDRIVHHALVRAIEPIFERRFIHHSYANRKGKGTHRALFQFVEWARARRFMLKMDVKKFFPSIDHLMLKEQIRRAIRDPRTLSLIDDIIDGSNAQEPVVQHFPGDDLLAPLDRRIGVPIGGRRVPRFRRFSGGAPPRPHRDETPANAPPRPARPLCARSHGPRACPCFAPCLACPREPRDDDASSRCGCTRSRALACALLTRRAAMHDPSVARSTAIEHGGGASDYEDKWTRMLPIASTEARVRKIFYTRVSVDDRV